MILLDENVAEDQCQLLRKWRIRFRQIGQDIGRQGMKDEQQILPLLHRLDRPTFFTRDLDFFDPQWCHEGYALVCLSVGKKEVAKYVRRFMRHPSFNTKAKRLGTAVLANPSHLRVWRLHAAKTVRLRWKE
jgi:hypothetical protein